MGENNTVVSAYTKLIELVSSYDTQGNVLTHTTQ